MWPKAQMPHSVHPRSRAPVHRVARRMLQEGNRQAGQHPVNACFDTSVTVTPREQLRLVQAIWPVPVERMRRAWRASQKRRLRLMNAGASLTNAIVSRPLVPIKNPRRESIKKPPRWHTHLEDWRPTVALAGHIVVATVAGLRLVGGTVRSSQDAMPTLPRATPDRYEGLWRLPPISAFEGEADMPLG